MKNIIKEHLIEGFNLYPNPTTLNYINITSKKNVPIHVSIFNVIGTQIINKTVSDNSINISKLNPGIYIVNPIQNNVSFSKRLLVK